MSTGSNTPAPPAPPPAPGTQRVETVISAFREQRRFKAPDSKTFVTSLDFDDTGELALVSRDDETLQIYNCKEGKHAKELKSQKYGVHLARFSHHSQNIIYASTKVDDTIRYLAVHDNSFVRYFRGHKDKVTSIALSPADDTFLSCARDNQMLLWDLRSQNYQGKLNIHGGRLCTYDASASVIAVASQTTQCIELYDARNWTSAPFSEFYLKDHTSRFLSGQDADWTKMEFSNDGRHLVVSTTGNGHLVLDAFEGTLKYFAYRKEGSSGRLGPSTAPPTGPNAPTAAQGQGDTCISPDGQFLLGGCGNNTVLVWDISKDSTPGNEFIEPKHTLPAKCKTPIIGYNPRTHVLATADRDFYLWQPDPDLIM